MRVVVRGQFGVTVASQLLSFHQRHATSTKREASWATRAFESPRLMSWHVKNNCATLASAFRVLKPAFAIRPFAD